MTQSEDPGPSSRERDGKRFMAGSRKHGRLSTFFEKHYKWIAIISGLVVSMTLSIKDSFHEKSKDLSEAIESAEMFARIEKLNRGTNKRVDEIITRLDLIKEPTAISKAHITFYNKPKVQVELLTRGIIDDIETIEVLLPLVSDNNDLRASLGAVKDKVAKIIAPSELPTPGETENSFETIGQLLKLSRDIEEQEGYVERVLNAQKTFLEWRERFFGFVSYAIIGLGVGLSLAAKVFERPSEESVEIPEV